ncbi:TnsA endonuclease C-terminal domain-containing protein [Neobacillus niacini]|uniref:TnsA endonuclease C-terminal domain-containing protein n=1 Tax=Neobacillus niacini TaxID=86668 RepID=UPI002FFF2856
MIREWNDTTIKRFLDEGRGAGIGKDYKPWLRVQDIASQGRSTRIYSFTSQRVVHMLSDLQLYYFYLLEFDDRVVDIRENYPALDFHELNIPLDGELTKKLFNSKTKAPHVFEVSFLVTRMDQQNKPYYEARAIKSSSEFEKKTTIQRLELLHRYFERKQIDFGIVTEKEINKQFARNIGWILTAYDLHDYPDLIGNFHYLKQDMLNDLTNPSESFLKAFARLEMNYQLEEGLGLIFFKHLLATKQLTMDLSQKINLSEQVEKYNIEIPILEGDRRAIGG